MLIKKYIFINFSIVVKNNKKMISSTYLSRRSSSVGNNLLDYIENDYNSFSSPEDGSDKENQVSFLKDMDSDSNENIIEKSKDGNFGKVINFII